MASVSFIIGDDTGESVGTDPLQVRVTVTEVAGGDLQFTLEVLSGYIADLRGFFFDLADTSLIGSLSVVGANVLEGMVQDTNVADGPSVSSASLPPPQAEIAPEKFYAGLELGTPGADDDDIRSTTFTISSSIRDLSLADIEDQRFGVRAQSVGVDADGDGVADAGREGSSKLVGTVPSTFTVSGTKYEDTDGDGDGDVPWTHNPVKIFIDSNGDKVWSEGELWTLADPLNGGTWSISGVTLADVGKSIYEVVPNGSEQTGTLVQTVDDPGSGGNDTGNDFYNFRNFTISGTKFEDTDGDGTGDVAWTHGGVQVYIDDDNNGSFTDGVDRVATVAADGTWSISGLKLADVGKSIYEVAPAGSVQTGTLVQTVNNPGSGGTDTGNDFSNFRLFDISGYKWNDFNGDGDWDSTEAGIANWTIYLKDANGNIVETQTDSTGHYSFADLGPGTYTVYEQQKAGWDNTYNGTKVVVGASGVDDAGDFGVTELLNFGNHNDAPGVRTPGFWGSKFGSQFWDGIIGNEAKAAGADGIAGTQDDAAFANGELLPWNDSNGPTNGGLSQNAYMVLGGNGDSTVDPGELAISLQLAQALINASSKDVQDGKWMLGRDAVATQLNFLAGNPGGDGSPDNGALPNDDDPADLLQEAVAWLSKYTNAGSDGILSLTEFRAGTAVATSSTDWQSPVSGIEHSASLLHDQLDQYNNNGTLSLGGVTTTWATDADLII